MSKNSNHSDEFRAKHVQLICKELNETQARISEQGIYNYSIQFAKRNNIKRSWKNTHFRNLYSSRIRSFYSNLKSDSYIQNTSFKDRILSGEIDCSKISELSAHDIFPENWKELLDKKMKHDKLKYELKPEAMTDMFQCGRCGSRSCSYYEVQTRSADEPMTQFVNCLKCNNRWKQ